MIDEIRNRRELVELVNEVGFLPFFSGRIEGFSLPEESLNRIIKHIKKALPKMDEEKLRLLLKG